MSERQHLEGGSEREYLEGIRQEDRDPTPDPTPSPVLEVVQEARELKNRVERDCELIGANPNDGPVYRIAAALIASEDRADQLHLDRQAFRHRAEKAEAERDSLRVEVERLKALMATGSGVLTDDEASTL